MKVLFKAIVDYAYWLHVGGVLVILLCLRSVFLARRERERSIYSLEKEAATSQEFRFLTIGLVAGAFIGLVMFTTTVVGPRVTMIEPEIVEVTPAALVLPTVTPTFARATATSSPTPTRVRQATSTPLPALPVITGTLAIDTPTPEPTAAPALLCPDAAARLTFPLTGATLKGATQILGSASTANFEYFKIEVASPAKPGAWALITDLRRGAVAGGLLDVWDTTAFGNGDYTLRLVVVDRTGNYPEPCTVQVTVSN